MLKYKWVLSVDIFNRVSSISVATPLCLYTVPSSQSDVLILYNSKSAFDDSMKNSHLSSEVTSKALKVASVSSYTQLHIIRSDELNLATNAFLSEKGIKSP